MGSIRISHEHLKPGTEESCDEIHEREFEITSRGHPGRYYGPPENCFPAEGAEAEWDGDYIPPDKCSHCGYVYTEEDSKQIEKDLDKAFEEFNLDEYIDEQQRDADEARADHEYESRYDRDW